MTKEEFFEKFPEVEWHILINFPDIFLDDGSLIDMFLPESTSVLGREVVEGFLQNVRDSFWKWLGITPEEAGSGQENSDKDKGNTKEG